MNLKVLRTTFTNRSTIGELYVDDAFECFTLEDMVRPVKVPGMTAIPAGVYVVSVSFSNRFRRLLPEVHNVPNYTGVRIHPGNTDADTEGCILVGKTKAKDFIGNSRAAFDRLFARIQAAAQREKIFLEVTSAASAGRGLGVAAPATRGLLGVSPPPARVALVKAAGARRSTAKRVARAGERAATAREATRRPAGQPARVRRPRTRRPARVAATPARRAGTGRRG